jgi:hypothetical protein
MFFVCPQFCAAAYEVAMRLNWEFGSFCLPLFQGAMYFLQFWLLLTGFPWHLVDAAVAGEYALCVSVFFFPW